MELLSDAIGQYVDDNGKARVLVYKDVCLMISPIPPLNLPVGDVTDSSKDAALRFIKRYKFDIISQDVIGQHLQGLWIHTQFAYAYIPLLSSKPIEGIPKASPNLRDPMRTSGQSRLTDFHNLARLADFLKQYALFEFSHHPDNFDLTRFIVIPDHDYNISSLRKRLIRHNDVMYKNKRLIVPTEDVAKRLIYYTQTQYYNDSYMVKNYKNIAMIKNYYTALSDFRKQKNQLIFLSKSSLQKWREEQSQYARQVYKELDQTTREPYFYRHHNIKNGKLFILQNVENGELDLAIRVASVWSTKSKVNLGYKPQDVSIPPHQTIVFLSNSGKKLEYGDESNKKIYIMAYDSKHYAAMLFV
jgi:hypothetical protein